MFVCLNRKRRSQCLDYHSVTDSMRAHNDVIANWTDSLLFLLVAALALRNSSHFAIAIWLRITFWCELINRRRRRGAIILHYTMYSHRLRIIAKEERRKAETKKIIHARIFHSSYCFTVAAAAAVADSVLNVTDSLSRLLFSLRFFFQESVKLVFIFPTVIVVLCTILLIIIIVPRNTAEYPVCLLSLTLVARWCSDACVCVFWMLFSQNFLSSPNTTDNNRSSESDNFDVANSPLRPSVLEREEKEKR